MGGCLSTEKVKNTSDSSGSKHNLEGSDPYASSYLCNEIPDPAPRQQTRVSTHDISTYLPAYSLKLIPGTDQMTDKSSTKPDLEELPIQGQRILEHWRRAQQVNYYGHKGAWSDSIHRHGHIWLDSAYVLHPVTRTAILLAAAEKLIVGMAMKCNMTFFFTNYPNVGSDELSDGARRTLTALIAVFNSSTFLNACNLIKQKSVDLAGEKMLEFVQTATNFEEEDDARQKLIKLLRYTRQRMQRYWYGWNIKELNVKILHLYFKMAQEESEKQPLLFNNTAFIYRREIGNYKRLLKTDEPYEITCTLLLATPITPSEVEAIQKCQIEGADGIVEKEKWATEGKSSLSWLRKGTHENHSSSGEPKSIAQELEKQGHPFCITSIVFDDYLGEQAREGYLQVDNFRNGMPDDINDVTFASQAIYVRKLFSPIWTFKCANSHDPHVDDWPELQGKNKYNEEDIVSDDKNILLPCPEDVRAFVFVIEDEDTKDDEDNAKILERLRREAGFSTT
jgi:hypothetical protein